MKIRSILFATVLVAAVILTACGGGDDVSEFDAYVACRVLVKRELVAPSTADFPPTSKVSIDQDGDNFIVAGYVDAENALGAKVRTNFVCDITYEGGDVDRLSSWRLENLAFLE